MDDKELMVLRTVWAYGDISVRYMAKYRPTIMRLVQRRILCKHDEHKETYTIAQGAKKVVMMANILHEAKVFNAKVKAMMADIR